MALGAVACQALRVQAIRLGPPAERAQKEAGRSGVGAMHGHPLFEKCGQERRFVTTRRFHHDKRLRQLRGSSLQEGGYAAAAIGKARRRGRPAMNGHVERLLADIDPDEVYITHGLPCACDCVRVNTLPTIQAVRNSVGGRPRSRQLGSPIAYGCPPTRSSYTIPNTQLLRRDAPRNDNMPPVTEGLPRKDFSASLF